MSEEIVTPAVASLNLAQKLAKVFAAIGYVQKDGKAKSGKTGGGKTFAGYTYLTELAVINEVRPLLVEEGVLVFPSLTGATREGNLATAFFDITFRDSATNETLTVSWAGTGTDTGDKAIYKAYTSGLRHFLMKFFMIPTGDDVEKDDVEATPVEPVKQPAGPVLSAAQTELHNKAKKLIADGVGDVKLQPGDYAEWVAESLKEDIPTSDPWKYLATALPRLTDADCERLLTVVGAWSGDAGIKF